MEILLLIVRKLMLRLGQKEDSVVEWSYNFDLEKTITY